MTDREFEMKTVTDECLSKDYKDMTKEELHYARKYEVDMLKSVEDALMLPDANDESLEMAKPLMEDCKKSIKKVDELLGVR